VAYVPAYAVLFWRLKVHRAEKKTARIFRNNRNQAVRIPKEFEFAGREVFIHRQGDAVILSARPRDWSELLSSDAIASSDLSRWVKELSAVDGSFS
jgi:antitoxin VapB